MSCHGVPVVMKKALCGNAWCFRGTDSPGAERSPLVNEGGRGSGGKYGGASFLRDYPLFYAVLGLDRGSFVSSGGGGKPPPYGL